MPEAMILSGRKIGFTTLYNTILQDKHLSLKTKGLFAVMQSLPGDWSYSISGLAAYCGVGKATIRSGLDELEAAGYLQRGQDREGGRFGPNVYVLNDLPGGDPPSSENRTTVEKTASPSSGFPTSENPSSENRTQTKDYSTKDYITKPPKAPQRGAHYREDLFLQLYKYYPRHVDRKSAQRAFDKLRPDAEEWNRICAALKMQKHYWASVGTELDKIPYLSTWLNKARFDDPPEEYQVFRPSARTDGPQRGWAPDPEVIPDG